MDHTFAERVRPLKPEGAYAVLARARALEVQGRDIIHLEIGQPDFPTPAHIAQAGADAILDGHTRYTPPVGSSNLRAAIAETAGSQRGMTFSPEEVIVGPGGKPAIFYAAMALIEAGDEVIIFPTRASHRTRPSCASSEACRCPFGWGGKNSTTSIWMISSRRSARARK